MFVSLQVMRNLRFEGSKFCDSPKTRVIGPSRWRCRWSFLPMSGSRGSRESSHCTEPLYNDPHRSSPWAARQSLPKRQRLTPRLAVDRTHLLIPSDPTTFGRCWYGSSGSIWFIKNTQGLSTYCLDAQLLQFYRILGSEFRSIHLFMGKQAPHSQPQRLWLGEAPPCAKTPWPRIAGKIQRRADRIPSALPFRQKLWTGDWWKLGSRFRRCFLVQWMKQICLRTLAKRKLRDPWHYIIQTPLNSPNFPEMTAVFEAGLCARYTCINWSTFAKMSSRPDQSTCFLNLLHVNP